MSQDYSLGEGTFDERKRAKYDRLYNELQLKGEKFFEPGYELYYLSMAYEMMIVFIQEEQYEKCHEIKAAIIFFMFDKPGALDITIRNMPQHHRELLGIHIKNKKRNKNE
jgi:hypothetical protein